MQLQKATSNKDKGIDALIKKLMDLQMQLENIKEKFENDKEVIVRTALLPLDEKINTKLFKLHEVCKLLYLAKNKIEDDKRLVKPTY